MHDAPDKPNPEGFLTLAKKLLEEDFGHNCPPVAYVGDTIADIQTIINARKLYPSQRFISIGVTPPHLMTEENFQTPAPGYRMLGAMEARPEWPH